jgi:O-antigen/teichoic acid export membrane protein
VQHTRDHSVQRSNTPPFERDDVLIERGDVLTSDGACTAASRTLAQFSPGWLNLKIRSVPLALLRPDLRKLTTSGSFALADQFLFAASQLILNLGLARGLSPSGYGAFTVAYAAFLLFAAAHTALLAEPLMVFGSSKYSSSFLGYLRLLVRGHMIVTGLVGVLVALTSLLLASSAPSLSTALFYLGVCGPLILLPWLLRRACYARQLAHTAAFGGALYFASMLAGLSWLARSGLLSIMSALLLMAGASLAASLFMLKSLGLPKRGLLPSPAADEVVADHWRYGRWALGSGILTWVPTSIYYFLLPHFAGVDSAGALKAVMNLVVPVLNGYTALSMILLPALSGARSVEALSRRLKLALPLYLLPALVYCGIVIVYHRQIFEWLYAGQYFGASWLLAVAAPMVVAAGIAAVYSTALRALQRPDRVFWSYAFASGAALTGGVLLTARYHLFGAVLGLTITYVITAAVTGINFVSAMMVRRSGDVKISSLPLQ